MLKYFGCIPRPGKAGSGAETGRTPASNVSSDINGELTSEDGSWDWF